ncbi:MAG: MerR family transcriptional regulator [Clostridia bacterium]|nr:MerR family transcriptional regulator [Clostridia bacterium]
MNETKYTVGEVSRITGVPKDTLLYYDKIDLFKPKYVNLETKYRYYTYEQFWHLDIIVCCRNLNIPLATIREILNADYNSKIIESLKSHQKYAWEMSKYYTQVAKDIDWYSEQYDLVMNANPSDSVSVKYFPQKEVIYAENDKNIREYHVKLMEASRNVLKKTDSFRRYSGFTMNPEGLEKNNFMKIGEYVEFQTEEIIEIEKEYLRVLPEGNYAFSIVHVVGRNVDFSLMNNWLKEHGVKPEVVLVEEIGFQMFEYFGQGYPCLLKVKI